MQLNEVILIFILVNVNEFFSVKLLLCIAMFAVVFFSVMMSSGISLDDRTKVCVTVIYRFKKMYFCIVILEYLHIQTKRLKFF